MDYEPIEQNKKLSVTTILLIIIVLILAFFVFSKFFKNKTIQTVPVDNSNQVAQEENNNITNTNSNTDNNAPIDQVAQDQIIPSQDVVEGNPICDTGYDSMPESKIIFEQSETLITSFEKKCDGNYYLTFDYITARQSDPVLGDNLYLSNTNSNLRTYKIAPTLQVQLAGDLGEIPIDAYIMSLSKSSVPILNQKNVYIREASEGQAIFSVKVQNGIVVFIEETAF